MKEIIPKNEMFMRDESGEMVLAPNAIETLHDMEVRRKTLDKEMKKVKETLLNGMEEYGIKKVETDDLLITYVEPQERVTIDNQKLWDEYKSIAFKCQKITPVKSSVRITTR